MPRELEAGEELVNVQMEEVMKLVIIKIIARALHVQMAKWLIAINMMESGVSEKLPAQVFFDLLLWLIVYHNNKSL